MQSPPRWQGGVFSSGAIPVVHSLQLASLYPMETRLGNIRPHPDLSLSANHIAFEDVLDPHRGMDPPTLSSVMIIEHLRYDLQLPALTFRQRIPLDLVLQDGHSSIVEEGCGCVRASAHRSRASAPSTPSTGSLHAMGLPPLSPPVPLFR